MRKLSIATRLALAFPLLRRRALEASPAQYLKAREQAERSGSLLASPVPRIGKTAELVQEVALPAPFSGSPPRTNGHGELGPARS